MSCLSRLLTVVASRIGLAVVAIILSALPSVFSPCRLRARNQGSVFVRQIHADEGELSLFESKFKTETATAGQMRVSFRAAPDEDAQPDVTLNAATPIGARIQCCARVP